MVAAAATAQVAWLEKYDVAPDEIALGFDDAFRPAGQLVEEEQLSPAVLPQLQMIDQIFSEMSQKTEVDRWTRAALSADVGWDRARQLAREFLTAEGEMDAPLSAIKQGSGPHVPTVPHAPGIQPENTEVRHGVLLLLAAGVTSVDVVAHRDTWEWLAGLATDHGHFHTARRRGHQGRAASRPSCPDAPSSPC